MKLYKEDKCKLNVSVHNVIVQYGSGTQPGVLVSFVTF